MWQLVQKNTGRRSRPFPSCVCAHFRQRIGVEGFLLTFRAFCSALTRCGSFSLVTFVSYPLAVRSPEPAGDTLFAVRSASCCAPRTVGRNGLVGLS
jgi:hypothetical protein